VSARTYILVKDFQQVMELHLDLARASYRLRDDDDIH
jgi:hypothetical protein